LTADRPTHRRADDSTKASLGESPGTGQIPRVERFFHADGWSGWLYIALRGAASDGTTYLVFAGVGWVLGYLLFKRHLARRKVIQSYPARSEVYRELRLSLQTVLIYGLVLAATIWATRQGWTQLYWKIGEHSRAWFWGSIALTIVLHDTWFYWTHRLMHHPALFRWFHRAHHRSHNPSPWASYAFSPLEAVMQAAIFPLAVSLYPVHPAAFGLFMLWQITHNVLGHTGYEIYPHWLMDTWLGKVLNTPTNHVMHHEYIRGNYGLYFNVWDRLMGTNHERYEERFRTVTARPKPLAKPQT
jgi:sterol desaturase/sphingolipid hydroxylase (fatty acid hydroxylase superfamily)